MELFVLGLLRINFFLSRISQALKIVLSCLQGLPDRKWLLWAWSSSGAGVLGALCEGCSLQSLLGSRRAQRQVNAWAVFFKRMRFELPFSDTCPVALFWFLPRHSVWVVLYTPTHSLPILVLAIQINELSQVPPPVMLLPDDFKASSKIKVNNHLFHRYVGIPSLLTSVFVEKNNLRIKI